jgi:fructokinase
VRGAGYDLVFGVILGTGCGGGVVHRGHVITGRQAIAGEWGHMTLDPNGPPCYCGKRGCVEQYLSGTGLETRYAEAAGANERAPRIFEAAAAGEEPARSVVEQYLDHFGRALANVVNVLDPDIIVLGGGVSNAEILGERGPEAVARYVFSDGLDTVITRHMLGDSAGVIGAAWIGSSE